MKCKCRDKVFKRFGRKDLLKMFDQMVEWFGDQQIVEKGDPNCRCIYYATEDRFCNRDTACAAYVFMRQHIRTGDARWKRKAMLARDYVLDVQCAHGGFPEYRGRKRSDDGSAVVTGTVADSLIRAYELGMEFGRRDLEALSRMADFVLTLEWQPGAFYHDTNHLKPFKDEKTGELLWGGEGSKIDCQNTTALAAMTCTRVYHFLRKNGARPKEEWLDAAKRGVEHLLAGQDIEGQWPYLFDIEKSGYHRWRDTGHHALCMQCLDRCYSLPPFNADRRILKALKRAALWLIEIGLLQTKRGSKINWALHGSALQYFTSEYFFVAGPVARLGALDPANRKFWLHESLEVMRYVRNDLWDNREWKKEGPFQLTEAGVTIGYAWFGQGMGWCLYFMDTMIDSMGWWKQ